MDRMVLSHGLEKSCYCKCMDNKMKMKALMAPLVLILVFGLFVFVPAGTLNFWQAWLFLFVWWAATMLITASLIKNDPALLARRMKGGPTAEKRLSQRIIMSILSVL